MTITARVDVAAVPPTLTVTSDKRKVTVAVTCAGETATGTATYPVLVGDASHVWTLKSDDGTTAVYTG